MTRKKIAISVGIIMLLAVLSTGIAISAQDKYTLKVPNGLAFSEFRGYEGWQVIAVSQTERACGDPREPRDDRCVQGRYSGNGKPFPDGAKMAKIHWNPKKNESEPGQPLVPGTLHDVDFMAKDSKRFADSGGWGYAEFEYDAGVRYVQARHTGG